MPKARKGGEHERGINPPYRLGVSPEIFFLLYSASNFVLIGFNAFGTRLQSLWMMFFFARKDIPCGVKKRMLDRILFRQLRFSLFSSACYFDIMSPQVFVKVLLALLLIHVLSSD